MSNKQKPNILLIITDQQSADALGCQNQGGHLRTPAMDAIASNGVLFNRAYCPHPLCVPCRASLFSGRYPHETGVFSNADLSRDMSAFPCLGAVFRDAGYDTGYVGKWHTPYPIENSNLHGFKDTANIRNNGADIHNNEKAIRFLEKKRHKPFLLVASYNNPHNICEWGRGGRGDLPDGVIETPPPLDECPPLRKNHLPEIDEADTVTLLRRSYQATPMFPVSDFGEREWREYQWAYYRMVEILDARIGELLGAVHAVGYGQNTAIVFLSDHGDSQGAHQWNQKTNFYDESSRVPFIISGPEKLPRGTSDQLVQVGVDLYPTLCGIAGIDAPPGLPGTDALKLAREGDETTRPWIVSATRFVQGGEVDGSIPEADGRMVRGRRFKYCVYDTGDHRESLSDMEKDPGETVNLARNPDYLENLNRHRIYLKEFCSETADTFPYVPPFAGRSTP